MGDWLRKTVRMRVIKVEGNLICWFRPDHRWGGMEGRCIVNEALLLILELPIQ